MKKTVSDLAIFNGSKLFPRPVSTSNLVKPNVNDFLDLLKIAQTKDGEEVLTTQLEKELANFHSVAHCVAVCSGFWALVLTIKALALPNKSEVIMPSLTYRRLSDVVAWAGLVPRFCEVDSRTLAISSSTVAPHISANTALIIGVHPIVNCCNAHELESIAEQHNIPILFDSVESVYETHRGKKVGSFGIAECFSLHASKLINGFEGGYITTHDTKLATRLRRWRNPSEHQTNMVADQSPGMEAKLPAAHAAMALQGLRELHEQIEHNLHIYRTYQALLPSVPGLSILTFNEIEHTSFKNIVVKLTPDWPLSRETTISLLNAEGILSRAYYSPPLHLKLTKYPVISSSLPFTEKAEKQYMLMPCGYQTTIKQVEDVINFLKFIYNHADHIVTQLECS